MVLTKSRSRNKARMKDQYESRSKDSSSSPKKQLKTGPVVIYNIACLLPIHKQLGENYVWVFYSYFNSLTPWRLDFR